MYNLLLFVSVGTLPVRVVWWEVKKLPCGFGNTFSSCLVVLVWLCLSLATLNVDNDDDDNDDMFVVLWLMRSLSTDTLILQLLFTLLPTFRLLIIDLFDCLKSTILDVSVDADITCLIITITTTKIIVIVSITDTTIANLFFPLLKWWRWQFCVSYKLPHTFNISYISGAYMVETVTLYVQCVIKIRIR